MAYSDFKTTRQLEVQSRMFRKGLTRVLNRAWLEMFNHDELNLMISGKEADFDVEDLRKHTVYNGYTEKDTTVMHFWELVRSMTSEQKSLLLLFVTSCSRPPTLGFSELKPNFCIAKSEELGFLPTAHTCMNILRLPNYKNRQTLR
jgi:ubiquitin-protein ligase E3 C